MLAIAWILPLLLTSCAAPSAGRAPSLPTTAEDNTAALKLHPQFPRAALAAPDFTAACFETIHRLEREKANGR